MNYSTKETLLKLENVSLSFGGKLVLRDINLEVKDIVRPEVSTGQIVTLLARSGVGKTVLMKVISGLIAPTSGRILVGKEQKDVKPGIVGMVMQNYPLFAHRTLFSNLLLVCTDKEKVNSYMIDFDIYQHKDKYIQQLSGGQRQRTAIVQQLLCSEHFILCDEIFSGLDPVAIEKTCSMLLKASNQDESNTLIISSHILEPALAISDSVYMLGYEERVPGNPTMIYNGATIRYSYDLAAEGLAWNPDIRKEPKFIELVENIRKIFQTL